MILSFQTFRDRHPDAHIISDLLTVQSGRFVVRVTVTTSAAGSASGLSVHDSIEIAEDQARQRAFTALGWPLDSDDKTAHWPQASADTLTIPVVPPATHTEPLAFTESTPDTIPNPPSPPSSMLTQTEQTVSFDEGEPLPTSEEFAAAAIAPPQPSPVAQPLLAAPAPAEITAEIAAAAEPTPQPEPTASPAATLSPEKLPAPINLSDVIAQTDIELRRLGWSVETGRDYLEKTYEKRSRHELSEEELIQFLCHLESL